MSSPRRLLAPECDVQRLQVSFHVGRCWRELERKACDTLSTRDQANAAACPKVVDLRPASIKEHHRASCVPVMARRVASLSRTGLPQYRALGVGATPCRLVSLIHTFGGPYGSSLETCFTPTRNNKRHSGVCATRLSASWRWPARSQKCQTASALRVSDLSSTGSTWLSSSAT